MRCERAEIACMQKLEAIRRLEAVRPRSSPSTAFTIRYVSAVGSASAGIGAAAIARIRASVSCGIGSPEKSRAETRRAMTSSSGSLSASVGGGATGCSRR